MPVQKPQDMGAAFCAAFNSGSEEALLALYATDAVLALDTGAVSGHAAIREALRAFLAVKGAITIDSRYCHQCGDTALLSGSWCLRGTGPDGKPVESRGVSAEVVRRQPDGGWVYVIDHPFGAT